MNERVVRVALALVAVVVIGWSAVLTRDWVIGRAAADRLQQYPDMSQPEWNHSIDQLRRAKLLDPSDDWTLERASYLVMRDRRGALRLLKQVLRDQPDYLEAWVVIASAARGLDPRLVAHAQAEIRRLDPVPRGG